MGLDGFDDTEFHIVPKVEELLFDEEEGGFYPFHVFNNTLLRFTVVVCEVANVGDCLVVFSITLKGCEEFKTGLELEVFNLSSFQKKLELYIPIHFHLGSKDDSVHSATIRGRYMVFAITKIHNCLSDVFGGSSGSAIAPLAPAVEAGVTVKGIDVLAGWISVGVGVNSGVGVQDISASIGPWSSSYAACVALAKTKPRTNQPIHQRTRRMMISLFLIIYAFWLSY